MILPESFNAMGMALKDSSIIVDGIFGLKVS